MQSPAHFAIGAALCRAIPNRAVGLLAAAASHFALDALPHFEDPSILPRGISSIAGRHWTAILVAAQVATVALACITVARGVRARQSKASITYWVVGGFLACLPDYLHWVFGVDRVIGALNEWSHGWWTGPYLDLVRQRPATRPAVAAACLAIESGVLTIGLWGAWRSRREPASGEDDGEERARP